MIHLKSNNITTTLSSEVDGDVKIEIFDSLGKLVISHIANITKGLSEISIPLPHMIKGVYVCNMSVGEEPVSRQYLLVQ